jgi:hypothetical protein
MLKTPTRRSVVENFPLYYPFGITRFHNILKDLNCGIGFENGIKVIGFLTSLIFLFHFFTELSD